MPSTESIRIAKNMIALYLRMLFQMGVFFWTSRILLSQLGVNNFGIFDVVAGFVLSLSVLNYALANSTLRYITYAIGKGEPEYIKRVFSISINIHLLLATLVVLLGEPIGLWYIHHKMQFPLERTDAVLVTFHCALVSAFMTIMSVPYNTLIIAYEKMTAYAYLTILDVSLKLLIVLSLIFSPFDKLIMYAVLLALESILIRIIYAVYCSRTFQHARYKWIRFDALYKDMLTFSAWSSFGNLSYVANTSGLNLLINFMGGPILGTLYNSARAVAFQVQTAINSFINAFQTSINPQITKTYAQGEFERTNHLVLTSSRLSYSLALIIIVPIIVEGNTLLSIWLSNVPAHALSFMRILLVVSLIDALANPLMIAADATGRIKRYQFLTSLPLLCTIPLAYVLIKITDTIEFAFIALIITSLVGQIWRVFICRGLYNFPIRIYVTTVISKLFILTMYSFSLPFLLQTILNRTILHSAIIVLISIVWTIGGMFFIILKTNERKFIFDKIRAFVTY